MAKPILKNRMLLFWIAVGGLCTFFPACAPVEKPVDDVCPPEYNVLEAMAVLSGRWRQVQSFYANGQCLWTGRDPDGKKRRENFPIKIWAEPPERFCLHGDILFNPRGMVAGANREEFWLAIRPKELRGYLWGKQTTIRQCMAQLPLPMNPQDILDALGMIRFEADSTEQNWSLTPARDFDILTNRDSASKLVKKVYIDRCDYLVRKIEYFDKAGEISVVAELGKYQPVGDEFLIPTIIDIKRWSQDSEDETVKITLRSVKPKEFSDKQKNVFFSKPDMERFESVLMLSDDCEWIEQDL